MKILDEWDQEHFELLVAIQREADRPRLDGEDSSKLLGALVSDLATILPALTDIMGILINSLVLHGLIRNAYEGKWDGMGGIEAYLLTDLGKKFLDFLNMLTEQHAND